MIHFSMGTSRRRSVLTSTSAMAVFSKVFATPRTSRTVTFFPSALA